MAALLAECGPLIRGTVGLLAAVPPGSVAAPPTAAALHRLRLAESAYAQFRSEPGSDAPARADWHGVLIAARHILLGAQWLPRFDRPAAALPAKAAALARDEGDALARSTDRLAAVCGGRPPPAPAPPRPVEPIAAPQPALVDLDVWLRGLSAQLARIEAALAHALDGRDRPVPPPAGQGGAAPRDTVRRRGHGR